MGYEEVFCINGLSLIILRRLSWTTLYPLVIVDTPNGPALPLVTGIFRGELMLRPTFTLNNAIFS